MEKSTCSMCERKIHARGPCRVHYGVAARSGSIDEAPMALPPVTEWHRLSDVDPDARTGICSVCGFTNVRIRKNGKSAECMFVRNRNRGPGGGYRRSSWVQRTYGLTATQFSALQERAGGRCEICGRAESETSRRLAVDHDHETGIVRGLLCGRCNTGIGLLGDSLQGLQRAIDYLAGSSKQEHYDRA